MFDWNAYLTALLCTMAVGVAAWIYSLWRRDVSIVDSLWSLMILASLLVSLLMSGTAHLRGMIITLMVSIWALRLSAHITIRNHGMPEDRRYQAIRQNNQPRFWLKSLYIVFGLQAFLAWVVSLPAVAAAYSPVPLNWLDLVAVAVWAAGMYFEVVGDWQLMQFQRNRNNSESVLNHGLWRYTRHPNYFGEALLWWGIYLAALAAGAWWAFIAPVLMTILLLRISGVALLEKDISERRPAYRDYIERTNAFLPGPPKAAGRPADSLKGA